jgi:SAM-dependent methyltransferase
MSRTWLHRVLESPLVYRVVQALVGGSAHDLDEAYDRLFGDVRGQVLDVGCGPSADTPPPEGSLVGLDVNPRYVEQYCRTDSTGPQRLGVVASAERIPFRDDAFDECRTAAVLHHLPDELVKRTFVEMHRTVRRGGRIAVFDMVWPRSFWSSPVAWLICRFDRGEWVRTDRALLGLARSSCDGEWESHSFSYTWLGLRGVTLVLCKR